MYTKVMLALDGSEEPSQLVSTATQLTDEERGQMLVVHLTELPPAAVRGDSARR